MAAPDSLSRFDFDACRAVLFDGLYDALKRNESRICGIKRTGRGTLPITGISYDVCPWHGGCGISMRLHPEGVDDATRWSSGDWELFDFIVQSPDNALGRAAMHIESMYREAGEARADIAHLIFLAAAEALLDRRIADFFLQIGVDAPIVTNEFERHFFEWIVTDPDATVKGNYCEIVKANRATLRLLGRIP